MGGFCTAGEQISVSSSAKKGWVVPLLLQRGGGGSSTAVERMDGSFIPRERVSGFTTGSGWAVFSPVSLPAACGAT